MHNTSHLHTFEIKVFGCWLLSVTPAALFGYVQNICHTAYFILCVYETNFVVISTLIMLQ